MVLSKRITAMIMVAIMVCCMSGYLQSIPRALGELRRNTSTEAVKVGVIIDESEKGKSTDGLSTWDKFIKLKDASENQLNNIACRYQFIELNGGLSKVLNKNLVLADDPKDNTYRLKNGYLTFINEKQELIPEYADNMTELNDYLTERGINLLYVQVPHKNSKFDNLLPEGVEDYTNENADEFLSLISEGGIDYIDLRQVMYDEGINQYDMFFKTDHHWKPETGLWAVSKIFDYLNINYGYNISESLCNIDNYNIDVYKDIFLGSQGKKTGLLYGGLDDISLIYPKFNTNLTFSVPSKKIYKEGSFEDTIFDYERLQYDYYNADPYAVYTGTNVPLAIIENKDGGDKKVLLIKDSFGRLTAPFLCLGFSELHMFDIRYNSDYTVYEYIDYYNPDIVIFLYNCSMLGGDDVFVFDKISNKAKLGDLSKI